MKHKQTGLTKRTGIGVESPSGIRVSHKKPVAQVDAAKVQGNSAQPSSKVVKVGSRDQPHSNNSPKEGLTHSKATVDLQQPNDITGSESKSWLIKEGTFQAPVTKRSEHWQNWSKVSLSDMRRILKERQDKEAEATIEAVSSTNDQVQPDETGEGSVAVEVPSNCSEPVGLEDSAVYRASIIRSSSKPRGSAIVVADIRIGDTAIQGKAGISVDTGADETLCTIGFLEGVLGPEARTHIRPMKNPPRLRSATGHYLTILGRINLVLTIGTYTMDMWVIVQEGDVMIFLLGSDMVYDRITIDKGKHLIFANGKHPPVPIFYTLESKKLGNGELRNIAPNSSALFLIKLTDDERMRGKDVLISPLDEDEEEQGRMYLPIVKSVAKISQTGHVPVLIENLTDDLLIIEPGCQLACVNLLSDDEAGNAAYYVDVGRIAKVSEWPEDALSNEFIAKLPANVQLRKHNLRMDKMSTNSIPYCIGLEEDPARLDEARVNFIHDREERRQFMDGEGVDLPLPPAAEPCELQDPSDPDEWLNNINHSHLTESQWAKLRAVIVKYRDAFSKSKTEIGCCTYFRAGLPLKPGTGYLYNKPRPMSLAHKQQASTTISDLLEMGVIRPSKSPHATNIVVVKKKALNGVVQHRVCVDLRQVNENSIPNRFPNFQIEDAMAKVQGSAIRTALDFANAFHQILLTEESIPVTAFYFDGKLYEYVRLPFGHVCAMNIFCCVMALLCEKYEPCTYYADDLIVVTKEDKRLNPEQLFDQHLVDICGMLERVIKAGLKLKAYKCNWAYDAKKPLDWLGKTMEGNLLRPQQGKLDAMIRWPTPTTAKQALSWAAMVSYYRGFIQDLAEYIKPVNDTIRLANKTGEFVWTKEAQEAFEFVKGILCSDLVIRMPVQGKPFILHTDASHIAVGVVLSQIDDEGIEHPCAYASRKFNDTELKQSSALKELCAIIYGLQMFSFYLLGNQVHIYSDCRAWSFLKLQTGISGKISRYAMLVSDYDIVISYIPGPKNKVADGLSRAHDIGESCDNQKSNRHPALEQLGAPALAAGQAMKLEDYLQNCEQYLESEWPKVLSNYEAKQAKEDKDSQSFNNVLNILEEETSIVNELLNASPIFYKDRVAMAEAEKKMQKEDSRYSSSTASVVADSYRLTEDGVSKSNTDTYSAIISDDEAEAVNGVYAAVIGIESFTHEGFHEAQTLDDNLRKVIDAIKLKDPRVSDKGYFLKRNVLMRRFLTKDGQEYDVICVPSKLVPMLLQSTHGSLVGGHHGGQRYQLDMSRRYYWKGMGRDIETYQKECFACQVNDKHPVRFQSGTVIRPQYPMHIVHFDLMVGLPKAKDGSYAIILFYDGFSRYTFGIPLASEKADYIVRKIMSQFIAAFGFPTALHSDNGKNIDGNLMRHLAAMLGISKTTTPPHTPNANPCETACGAVAMLIRKALNDSDKKYWPQCLPFILYALNNTVHTTHGYTPSSLFFGRFEEKSLVPLVPFESESANITEYAQKVRRFQEIAYQIARVRNEKKITAKKEQFDKTARKHPFSEGSFVMVKNLNPADGPGRMKLRAKYLGPYRVLKAYPASLALVPWSENDELERYLKDPGLFKLAIKADLKPFSVKMVSVKHCKPYKGRVDQPVNIIDPHLLNDFLDKFDIHHEKESISVIEVEQRWDQSSTTSRRTVLPEPAGPVHEPIDVPSEVDALEELLDTFEMDQRERKLLVERYLEESDQPDLSESTRAKRIKVTDLLKAAQSADRRIREGAARELDALLETIHQSERNVERGEEQAGTAAGSISDTTESVETIVEVDPLPPVADDPLWDLDSDLGTNDMPELGPASMPASPTHHSTPVSPPKGSAGRPTPTPKTRSSIIDDTLSAADRTREWVEVSNLPTQPLRASVRLRRPTERFDPAEEEARMRKDRKAASEKEKERQTARLKKRFKDVGEDIEVEAEGEADLAPGTAPKPADKTVLDSPASQRQNNSGLNISARSPPRMDLLGPIPVASPRSTPRAPPSRDLLYQGDRRTLSGEPHKTPSMREKSEKDATHTFKVTLSNHYQKQK